MTETEIVNIKDRLSNIGEKVGELALKYISKLEKENAALKAQIEKLKCGHSYVVSDDHSNSVPCYTVYECKYCSKR